MSVRGVVRWKGGPGSGHHDHAGRPGEVGGSQPGTGTRLSGKSRYDMYVDQINAQMPGSKVPIIIVESASAEVRKRSNGKYNGWMVKGFYDHAADEVVLEKEFASAESDEYAMPSGYVQGIPDLGWKWFVAHEAGHRFDYTHRASDDEYWNEIVDAYVNVNKELLDDLSGDYPHLVESIISIHSLKSDELYTETFAEAFSVFINDPDWLGTHQPDMYNYLQSIQEQLLLTDEDEKYWE